MINELRDGVPFIAITESTGSGNLMDLPLTLQPDGSWKEVCHDGPSDNEPRLILHIASCGKNEFSTNMSYGVIFDTFVSFTKTLSSHGPKLEELIKPHNFFYAPGSF